MSWYEVLNWSKLQKSTLALYNFWFLSQNFLQYLRQAVVNCLCHLSVDSGSSDTTLHTADPCKIEPSSKRNYISNT